MLQTLPTHVGFILDGNRRWAKENNLPSLEGHKRGAEVFKDIALYAFDSGVSCVSGYVFSTENWQRTEEEVGYLMTLAVRAIDNYLETFHKEGVRIVVLGRRDGLRSKVLKAIVRAEETTKDNVKGTLSLCFNYGGQEEIVDALKTLVRSGVKEKDISNESIEQALYHPEIPPLDYIIRTSGEQRLSGFMMWRSMYAELYFCDKFWPAFTSSDLDNALRYYQLRERRFGN